MLGTKKYETFLGLFRIIRIISDYSDIIRIRSELNLDRFGSDKNIPNSDRIGFRIGSKNFQIRITRTE